MKQAISTSIEQSRRLLSCGVAPKTADMVWLYRGEQEPFLSLNRGCNRAIPEVGDVPAWSLSVLLAMLPNNIMGENRKQFTFCLCKCKTAYIVAYGDENTDLYQINGTTTIEACVRMIEYLAQNNYPLNKIE